MNRISNLVVLCVCLSIGNVAARADILVDHQPHPYGGLGSDTSFADPFGRPGKRDIQHFGVFEIGVVDSPRFAESKKPGGSPLPGLHSATFQVEPGPTITTGVRCMTGLALGLLAAP